MIAVTVDGSERSRHVIPHAAALAHSIGSQLGLLRVFDAEAEIQPGPQSWPARFKTAAGRIEAELIAVAEAQGVAAKPLVGALYKGESVSQAILRLADEPGASLIAMDSRGHGAVRHASIGSVAMGVLAGSDVPVMMTGPAIQAPRDTGEYRLLITSDGSKASEKIVTSLEPFLSYASISLLTVYVPKLGDLGDQAELATCYERLSDIERRLLAGNRVQTIVRRATDLERPEGLVFETASEIGANALAMSTQGHNPQHHVLLGSFAAACLGKSPLPIILARQ